MAQQGMAMLTRVGNSGLWQSMGHYGDAAQPFHQERALSSLLKEFMLIETNYLNIWRDTALFAQVPHGLYNKMYCAWNDATIDYLVDWFPVMEEEVEGIDEAAHAVVAASSAIMLTPRLYRTNEIVVVSLRYFKCGGGNITPVTRVTELTDDLAYLWSLCSSNLTADSTEI